MLKSLFYEFEEWATNSLPVWFVYTFLVCAILLSALAFAVGLAYVIYYGYFLHMIIGVPSLIVAGTLVSFVVSRFR